MATVVIPNVFAPNTVADANAVNANFTALANAINDGVPSGSLVSTVDLSALNWYNYFNFGALTTGGPASNASAFLAMLAEMAALNEGSGGGLGFIPSGSFQILPAASPALGYTIPVQSVFQGAGATVSNAGGNGGPAQSTLSMQGDGTFLYFTGQHTSGGVYFKNLAFGVVGAQLATTTAIYASLWNMSVQDCIFLDYPTCLNLQGLANSALRCTINYNGSPVGVTAIVLEGIQCEISGPSEYSGNDGGGNNTCIVIAGGPPNCDHCTIRNVHIYGWDYGIDYQDINGRTTGGGGCQNHVISGVKIDARKTAVNLQPSGSSGVIFNQTFTDCLMTKSQNSTDGSPIFLIDTNGGPQINVGPVYLVNPTIYSNVTGGSGQGGGGGHTGVAQLNQYGVQIESCEYVSIIGGQISHVGTVAGNDGTANVCISGDPVSVIIDGVNLSQSYAGANAGRSTGSTGAAPSEYSLLVSGSPIGLTVSNCLLGPVLISGNPTAARISNCQQLLLTVTSTQLNLIVTECQGYNDQKTAINTLANITSGVTYKAATQGSNGGTSYFGPSVLMFTASPAGGAFTFNGGTAQNLLANQVVTLPLLSPYDTFEFGTHAPFALEWIGE